MVYGLVPLTQTEAVFFMQTALDLQLEIRMHAGLYLWEAQAVCIVYCVVPSIQTRAVFCSDCSQL